MMSRSSPISQIGSDKARGLDYLGDDGTKSAEFQRCGRHKHVGLDRRGTVRRLCAVPATITMQGKPLAYTYMPCKAVGVFVFQVGGNKNHTRRRAGRCRRPARSTARHSSYTLRINSTLLSLHFDRVRIGTGSRFSQMTVAVWSEYARKRKLPCLLLFYH
jgi:hypothetical protein